MFAPTTPPRDLRQRLASAVRDGDAMSRLAIGLMSYPVDADAVSSVLGPVERLSSLDAIRPLPPEARALATAAAHPRHALETIAVLPHPDGTGASWVHVLCRASTDVCVVSSLRRPGKSAVRCACLTDGAALWFWLDAGEEPLDQEDAELSAAATTLTEEALAAVPRSGEHEGKQVVELDVGGEDPTA